jgi:uncharacterized protein (DUF58 family)
MVAQWTALLEQRWIAPAYAGWVAIAVSICFFGAATNTMTGWLYVLSAIGIVLTVVAAILPLRSLKALSVEHLPIDPTVAGEDLKIPLRIHNCSPQAQILFQLWDQWPIELGESAPVAIERVPGKGHYDICITSPSSRRGLYRWQQVELRSGQPLGLFWGRRTHISQAQAWVYPQQLRLERCPILENLRDPRSIEQAAVQIRPQLSTSGSTRSLRTYRTGDPLRLVHWRSSARYGQLQVRELEEDRSTKKIVIALDTSGEWTEVGFEQAVIAAASLYVYCQRQQLPVHFWCSSQGLITGKEPMLRALAEIQRGASGEYPLPDLPLLWLNAGGATSLPPGSRSITWADSNSSHPAALMIDPLRPLVAQLQQPIRSSHG